MNLPPSTLHSDDDQNLHEAQGADDTQLLGGEIIGTEIIDSAILQATSLGPSSDGLNAIRIETALSRFPCHRISRKGNVTIEIKRQNSPLFWEVTYNSKYGQPGPLAYKVDTLIVNSRLDRQPRPVPRILRLGSLRDICRELDINEGSATGQVKKALHQNASAYIDAKFSYRATDGTKRDLEAGFNRYAVVFTGETLPDGRIADAVYLILSDIYQEVLNHALTRPLDYDYMKVLPPAALRFYEIVSYQIYTALKYGNPFATLLYSEYCLLSTATRYFDFDHVKKQMYKVHKPHLDSGYLLRAQYQATTDEEGRPDWKMLYTPGLNADREYQAFTGSIRGKRLQKRDERQAAKGQPTLPFGGVFDKKRESGSSSALAVAKSSGPAPEQDGTKAQSLVSEAAVPALDHALVAKLIEAGLNRSEAQRLAGESPDECRRQLAYLPYKSGMTNPGGYLRRAIEDGYTAPKEYELAQAQEERDRRKREDNALKKAEEERQEIAKAEEAQRLDAALARLEEGDPAAYRRFLDFVEGKKQEIEAKFRMLKPATRAKLAQNLTTVDGRRELFAEWQAQASTTVTSAADEDAGA